MGGGRKLNGELQTKDPACKEFQIEIRKTYKFWDSLQSERQKFWILRSKWTLSLIIKQVYTSVQIF